MPTTTTLDAPGRVRVAETPLAALLRAALELAGYAVDDDPGSPGAPHPCCLLVDTWSPAWRATVVACRRAHGDGLPIVLIGTDPRRAAADVAAVGAAVFLAQPFDLDDLDALVRTACGPWAERAGVRTVGVLCS